MQHANSQHHSGVFAPTFRFNSIQFCVENRWLWVIRQFRENWARNSIHFQSNSCGSELKFYWMAEPLIASTETIKKKSLKYTDVVALDLVQKLACKWEREEKCVGGGCGCFSTHCFCCFSTLCFFCCFPLFSFFLSFPSFFLSINLRLPLPSLLSFTMASTPFSHFAFIYPLIVWFTLFETIQPISLSSLSSLSSGGLHRHFTYPRESESSLGCHYQGYVGWARWQIVSNEAGWSQ